MRAMIGILLLVVLIGLGFWHAIWPRNAQSAYVWWTTKWWHLAPTEEWYRRYSPTALRVMGVVYIVLGAILLAALLVGRT